MDAKSDDIVEGNGLIWLPPEQEDEGDDMKQGVSDAELCDSQGIAVSLSVRCVWKGTICEKPRVLTMVYNESSDLHLGQFLQNNVFDQNGRCSSCEMPVEAHVYRYAHQQGSVTISVKKLAEFTLSGEDEGKIWMWHRCLKCPHENSLPPASRRVLMSDSARKSSFGKFLKLSFSSHADTDSVSGCGHSLTRDCLRFYGSGPMVACFRYDPIDVYSVVLPPQKLEFNYGNQELTETDKGVQIHEDEPSSIISYALLSSENTEKNIGESSDSEFDALHSHISFSESGPRGEVKYDVTCYYSKGFEALRKTCGISKLDFIRCLSRCTKYGPRDNHLIIKELTKDGLDSFFKFAPAYFKYISDAIDSRTTTCLAKILGIYQITSKNVKGGKALKMEVLVMENLVFGHNVARMYDLKGSTESRYNPDPSGDDKVLLDQNLIEAIPTSPIYVGSKAKRLLERTVWNDTSFLSSVDVMEYSLLVVVLEEEKHELVIGLIDYMRQYTWDKQLETLVKKASGAILGGSNNNTSSPTVIPPKDYKKRFRKAMSDYFIMVPDEKCHL